MQALFGIASSIGTIGAELTSLKKRNDRYNKERDAVRAEVDLVRSEFQEKHRVDLEAACAASRSKVVEEYKASECYHNM